MSTLRSMPGGWINRKDIPRGRPELIEHWGLKKRDPGKRVSLRRSRKTLLDADHILPVAEGGGECDLENMRTRCLRCHRAATAVLRGRVRTKRAAAAHPKPKSDGE